MPRLPSTPTDMRNISSSTVNGNSGIIIAVLNQWLKEFDLKTWVHENAHRGSYVAIVWRVEDIGIEFMRHTSVGPPLYEWLELNPKVKAIWDMAILSPEFESASIIYEMRAMIGTFVKSSQWWVDNCRGLKRSKKNVSIAKSIMES